MEVQAVEEVMVVLAHKEVMVVMVQVAFQNLIWTLRKILLLTLVLQRVEEMVEPYTVQIVVWL